MDFQLTEQQRRMVAAVRNLAQGEFNAKITKQQADNDYRALYGAGADVEYRRYAGDKQLHPNMMTDVNQWLINGLNAEHDL